MTADKEPRQVAIMVAADDRFAMPMTVTVYSALTHLPHDVTVDIFVADNGFSDVNRRKSDRVLRDAHPKAEVHWRMLDLRSLTEISDPRLTPATFSRIYVSDLVPPEVERVVYLDCDLIVCNDLTKLWDLDMSGIPLMAAIDGENCTFDKMIRSRFPEVTAPPDAPYFNSGVLLINMAEWRKYDMTERTLRFIARHGSNLHQQDQCALNATSVGLWKPLDEYWNTQVYYYRDRPIRPFGILHYTICKPWLRSAETPMAHLFFEAYRRSGWDSRPFAALWSTFMLCDQAVRRWYRYTYRPWKRAMKKRFDLRRKRA